MGNWFSTPALKENTSNHHRHQHRCDDNDDDEMHIPNTFSVTIDGEDEPSASSSPSPAPLPLPSDNLIIYRIVRNPTGHNISEVYYIDFRRQLGMGNFGVVHVCIDRFSGHEFACKTIWKNRLNSQKAIQEVRNEVAVLRHLRDQPEYVVPLEGVFEDDNAVHIVMEMCRGGTLQDQLAKMYRMPFREDEAARLISTIVQIIQVLHKKGVIHGDMKPANFIYANKWDRDRAKLRVIDFGLAHFFKPGEKLHDVNGTVLYMAPELWRQNYYGPEIDIWSAGVTLYQLLTRRFPYVGGNVYEMDKAINRSKLDLESYNWAYVSNNAKDLIAKMLNTNPETRITADQILKHPWIQRYTKTY